MHHTLTGCSTLLEESKGATTVPTTYNDLPHTHTQPKERERERDGGREREKRKRGYGLWSEKAIVGIE